MKKIISFKCKKPKTWKKIPQQTPTKSKRCSGKILNPKSKAKLYGTGKTFPSVSTLLLISERVHTVWDCKYFTFYFIRGRKAHFSNGIQKFPKGTPLDEAFKLWLLLTYNVVILHPNFLSSARPLIQLDLEL